MNKKQFSERDICTKFITPAIKNAGWDIHAQIREEVTLTAGRIIVRGQVALRAKGARADYVLYHKPGIPLAVVEAKDNKHGVGAGMQQALDYADLLNVPFAFSSNGDGFMFQDRSSRQLIERELALGAFPSPQYLWQRFKAWKGYSEQELPLVTQDYFDDGSGKAPRYYQVRAINAALEAIARGQDRVLLVMATGTGKTYTAFQIIWRLWQAGARKRVLFLADRNILVDQTKTNDFKPFGAAMTKITGRNVDPSYEVYLSLYQAITGPHEEQKAFKQFSRDFFDLIVIDECHRGSAAEDSAWREILEYFSAATHVGLTATPKETREVSNITYFGEPVYTYSLKQGIRDGFLAPYKVVRVDLDRDLQGWRPTLGQRDKYGHEIEDRIYNQRDFDRKLVIDERTRLVAKIVSDHLKATERMAKTIVFCQDIDHAERMRQGLVNENADRVARNRKYVMRITGDDTAGKAELDNFIDPEQPYPTLVTTSELLTTGVDAKTCKLIVLDQRIESMTKFKQMIGRGTRIDEDYGKLWFTIIDFRKATELFADPDFDGEPVVIFNPEPGGTTVPGDDDIGSVGGDQPGSEEGGGEPRKYHVSGITVRKVAERTQYFGKDGKLITESIKDYTRETVRAEYRSLDAFLRKWDEADQKAAVIQELAEQGVIWEALEEEIGGDYSAFDLICHVVFDQPPLTRRERAEQVRKQDYFARYGDKARQVLEALLEKYADSDVTNIESIDALKVQPLNELGTPVELVRAFGGKEHYQQAIQELERALYPLPTGASA